MLVSEVPLGFVGWVGLYIPPYLHIFHHRIISNVAGRGDFGRREGIRDDTQDDSPSRVGD